MPLKLTLKARERVIIGGAVIRNGNHRSELLIENEAAVLREKDILSPRNVTTVCERIYLALQLMYLDPANFDDHRQAFEVLVREVHAAAPSCTPYLEAICHHVEQGKYYRALKKAQDLLEHEKELIKNAA